MNRLVDIGDSFSSEGVTYNGNLIGDLPKYKETELTRHFFFTEERTSLNILLRTLNALSVAPREILSGRNGPDFEVHTQDGSTFFVETKLVTTPDDQITQRILHISAGLKEWIEEDRQAAERVRGLFLTFFIPSLPNSIKSLAPIMSELRRFIIHEHLNAYVSDGLGLQRVPEQYSILSALNTRIYCARAEASTVEISRGAMAVAQPDLVATYEVLNAIQFARQDAATWNQRPLWLIAWFTSTYDVLDLSGKSARTFIDLDVAPFERAVISDGMHLLQVA
jgi:hypothetical protein